MVFIPGLSLVTPLTKLVVQDAHEQTGRGQSLKSPSSIGGFIDTIKNGVARPTRYNVWIAPPGGEDVGLAATTANLAEAVTFPGRSLATVQRRHHGPQRDIPYERLFSGDLEITFLWGKDNSAVRQGYEDWMDLAIQSNKNNVASREAYTGTMNIEIEDGDFSITVNEVFPKLINPVSLGWNMNDEYLKQVITFSFFDYIVN